MELVVVMSIVGLFMVVSIPAYSRFQQTWRLVGEADRLAVSLRAARSRAVMTNNPTVFDFDVGEGTYSYFEDSDGDGGRDDDEYQSDLRRMSGGIGFKEHNLSSQRIVFEPKGNTLESGAIVLLNRRDHTRTITIYGGTGNVRVD